MNIQTICAEYMEFCHAVLGSKYYWALCIVSWCMGTKEPNGANWLCLLWPQRSFHCLYVQFHRTHQFIQYYTEVKQTEISVTVLWIETRLRTNYVQKEKTQMVGQHKYYTARINIDICGLLVSTRSLLYFLEQTTLQPQNHSVPFGAASTNQWNVLSTFLPSCFLQIL